MQNFKNISFFLLGLLLISSCSQYHKVLNNGTVAEQYKMATKKYEEQEYTKAISLFEKIIPHFRGKPQMERIQFMVANSYFNTKDYTTAGYYFNRFALNYPKSSKAEEAEFLSAYGYYKSSPIYSKDPTDTKKAIEAFQAYIDKYPNSERITEANKYYKELREKLEKKAFEIAKNYYHTAGEYDFRNYKASMTAFDNLLGDFLGTKYKEEALYYKLKAASEYALKSTNRRKLKRIEDAEKIHEKLVRSFPKSKYKEEVDKIVAELDEEKQNLTKK